MYLLLGLPSHLFTLTIPKQQYKQQQQQKKTAGTSHKNVFDPPRDLAFPHHPCATYPFSSQWQTSVGKSFVAEMAKLYDSFASGSALESIALTATIILLILLLVLQRPHKRSKSKEHTKCLERRLKIWRDGGSSSPY